MKPSWRCWPSIVLCLFLAPYALDAAPTSQIKFWKKKGGEEETEEKKEDKKEKKLQEIQEEIQEQIDQTALYYRSRYYPDEFLQGYVTQLGQSLVPRETPPGILFSFRVISDPEPNAVSLPDGRIFVHSGLLTFVENEAQLAVILGHEIGHVLERHVVEAIKQARSFKRGLFSSLAGGMTAALTDDAKAGQQMAAAVSTALASSYSRKQEDEADLIGCSLALSARFEASEGAEFFEKLAREFGDDDRLTLQLTSSHSPNADRARNIERLLNNDLSGEYTRLRSLGSLTVSTGMFRFHASTMVRDTAHQLAEVHDRYDLAKRLLESIMDLRARDPKALWYLGRIYKLVARTDEQRQKAGELFQQAIELDERDRYPEIYRDLGWFQASSEEGLAQAAESLRRYVAGYVTRYRAYPPDLELIYDYLLIFGDGQWIAPKPVVDFLDIRQALASLEGAAGEQKPVKPEKP